MYLLALVLVANAALVAASSGPLYRRNYLHLGSIQVRQDDNLTTCGFGATCEDACGVGYTECGSDTCYQPAEGENCCDTGNVCVGGLVCSDSGDACLDSGSGLGSDSGSSSDDFGSAATTSDDFGSVDTTSDDFGSAATSSDDFGSAETTSDDFGSASETGSLGFGTGTTTEGASNTNPITLGIPTGTRSSLGGTSPTPTSSNIAPIAASNVYGPGLAIFAALLAL